MRKIICLSFILVFLLMFSMVLAEDIFYGQEDLSDRSEISERLKRLAGAQLLVKYGRDVKSPLSLLAAAEIFATVPFICEEEKEVESVPAEGRVEEEIKRNHKDEEITFNPEDLINEALIMSGNDPHITVLAQELEDKISSLDPYSKGEIKGPRLYETNWIDGFSSDFHYFNYYVNELAEFELISCFESGIFNIYVYDENEEIVVSYEGKTASASVAWWPAETKRFKIEIVNLSDEDDVYNIWTN